MPPSTMGPQRRMLPLALAGATLVLLVSVAWFEHERRLEVGYSKSHLVASATYTCDQGRTIQASFYDADTPAPQVADMPPTPQGSVALVLSDGRTKSLPQTISGSGVRYASADDSFVFWSKGNTAFIEEGSTTQQTYMGCITSSTLPEQTSWSTFASSSLGISVRYPPGYTVVSPYAYQNLGPTQAVPRGVKFGIPDAMHVGTNLSSYDTGVSIEVLPALQTCSALAFLQIAGEKQIEVTDNDTTYFVASTSDAGAGNFYEEIVYALKDTNPCTAVRYFVHSTNIANYTPGAVQAFDRAALMAQFDGIRRSLVLGR